MNNIKNEINIAIAKTFAGRGPKIDPQWSSRKIGHPNEAPEERYENLLNFG